MKKLLLLFTLVALVPLFTASSQVLSDFVKQVKGDTLVVKTYDDMAGTANSLYQVMFMDTVNVPAGRVYELQAGGFYPLANNPNSSTKHKTVIYGADNRRLALNADANAGPALITGNVGTTSNSGGIGANGDLTIKNCAMVTAANDKSLNWLFTGTGASNLHILYENCIMERTRWVFLAFFNAGTDLTLRDCYFVNMNGQPCRRNGGVLDTFNPADTLVVENCTHINAQGSVYKYRDYKFNRIIMNHNTFINCAGYIYMDLGSQNNYSLTNSLFINSNIQAYPALKSIDSGEQDLDWLPMGLVNVYPDSVDVANNTPRKFLVQGNDAYWDPYLNDMISTLNTTKVNGVSAWQSQMIVANARTDSMFKHLGRFNTTPYSYMVMDTWKNKMPTFADAKNLFTKTSGGALFELKDFAVKTVDTGATGSAAVLTDWRLVNDPNSYYVYPDWPIPVNLSYSDADLMAGGIGGFPIGDLNWFPARKTAWAASGEWAKIDNAMKNKSLVINSVAERASGVPEGFQLKQNFPNPFNPSTVISFSIPKAGNVSLKVYNMLGEEVATLVNGYRAAQSYDVKWDGASLASGIYFYTLNYDGQSVSKKMVLLK